MKLQEEVNQKSITIFDEYFNRYFPLLSQRFSSRFRSSQIRIADEEDLSMMVIQEVFRMADSGDLDYIKDQGHLDAVVLLIAKRKMNDLLKYENAKKRGGGWNRVEMNESRLRAPYSANESTAGDGLSILPKLLNMLPTQTLKSILQLKLDGWDNQSIANELGISLRTAQYNLARIRQCARACVQ